MCGNGYFCHWHSTRRANYSTLSLGRRTVHLSQCITLRCPPPAPKENVIALQQRLLLQEMKEAWKTREFWCDTLLQIVRRNFSEREQLHIACSLMAHQLQLGVHLGGKVTFFSAGERTLAVGVWFSVGERFRVPFSARRPANLICICIFSQWLQQMLQRYF